MTTIRPLGDFLWVAPLADDSNQPYIDNKLSQQGMLMVVQVQKAATRGAVKAVGPGKRDEKGKLVKLPKLAIGDIVRWTPGSAQRIQVGDEKLYIVSAATLIGIEKP